jgi:hypothetical protein
MRRDSHKEVTRQQWPTKYKRLDIRRAFPVFSGANHDQSMLNYALQKPGDQLKRLISE